MKWIPNAVLAVVMAVTVSAHAELPGYLAESFQTKRWIAYSPTGPSHTPKDAAVIRDDLMTLHGAGFDGIVTYGCDGLLVQVPKLARDAGIKFVIVGVFDPKKSEELANAKSVASIVDGYCVGNEGLLEQKPRYTLQELRSAMDDLRKWTGRPVATTEQSDDYFDAKIGAQLIELGDWVFPNVHPFWHGLLTQPQAGEWTKNEVDKLKAAAKGRYVICKEVGLPTGNEDVEAKGPDQRMQADYYAALKALQVPFVYFEAFDQVWKRHNPVEPFWGLFDKDRHPKLAISQLGQAPPGVKITSSKDSDKVRVRMLPEGGFIDVSGTVSGLGNEMELAIFLNPNDPQAPGWFYQMEPNGVSDLDGEKWNAQCQVGNPAYPPRNGKAIKIRVLGIRKTEGERLRSERIKDPSIRDKGIYSQNLPKPDAQWRADLNDIVLDVPQAPR